MQAKAPFKVREAYNQQILELIKSVTLGSNGTLYQHQRIDERIKGIYKPIFFNLERGEKVLGNITFCRRPGDWYVRYFAFDLGMQSSAQKPKSRAKDSGLKTRVNDFFQQAFELETDRPDTFYAYIDPRNERSLWMSQNFYFKTAAKIATQTFSRVNPKDKKDVFRSDATEFIREKVKEIYGNRPYYFTHHTFNKDPFYTLVKDGEVVAFAKTYNAEWKIMRLPGKNGKLLKNIIPYIPRLRKIIRPNAHIFSVVDSIWVKDNDPKLLQELFEGILHQENTNTMIWWVDQKEEVYQKVKSHINWGLLHKINGVQEVDLVIRTEDREVKPLEVPIYVTGYDFI